MASVPLNGIGGAGSERRPIFAPISDVAPLATVFPGRGMGDGKQAPIKTALPEVELKGGSSEKKRRI